MSKFDIKLPKLGESIEEATILKWHIKEGDLIEEDQAVVDLATDKVDSEIPSPVSGKIEKIFFPEGSIVTVGQTIAVINLNPENATIPTESEKNTEDNTIQKSTSKQILKTNNHSGKYYSPLVKRIAKEENISFIELENIQGSGENGRVRKLDLINYLKYRQLKPLDTPVNLTTEKSTNEVKTTIGDQIVPMTRMRKLIAEHMLNSVHTSAHVTSVVEADVTKLVQWRNNIKDDFEKKYGQKLTYMPVFVDITAKALCEFPQINASTDGENIIFRKQVNIGIAVALPDWNLIVPVIKNADQKNIAGLAAEINKLADRARKNKLQADDIQGGTFSITNFGSFKNLFGTPIINQPQVAILATGSIQKTPAVLETKDGDVIAIRHKMFLALTYDHRIVDGALGGAFLRRIADLLEDFDTKNDI